MNTPENNEEQSTDSEDEEETASENDQFQEMENNDTEAESEIDDENSDPKSTTVIQQKDPNPCQHCEGFNVYLTAVRKSHKSFWHDNCEICPVCSHNIPLDRKHMKDEFKRCFDCGAVTHYNRKKLKETFYPAEG